MSVVYSKASQARKPEGPKAPARQPSEDRKARKKGKEKRDGK